MAVKYSFYFIALLVLFGGCKNNEQEIAIFNSVNESLEASTKNTENSNVSIYKLLDNRLSDPKTAEQSKVWQPKAMKIDSISTDLFNYIETLKETIKKKSNIKDNAKEIYEKLKKYQTGIINVDSEMSYHFSKFFHPISKSFSLDSNTSNDFYKTFFENTSTKSTLTVLSQIQNNIRVQENKMFTFCIYKTESNWDGYYKYGVLVGQNTNHLKSGEVLEIEAGVGAFSSAAKPLININGKTVDCIDGRANYKIKASEKIGKHSVPVKIEFTDQNGVKQISTSEVEYTVDE